MNVLNYMWALSKPVCSVVPPFAEIGWISAERASNYIELTFCRGIMTWAVLLKIIKPNASVFLILEKNIKIAYLAN